jgi:hypothetical protein
MPSAKDVTVDTEFLKIMSVGDPGTGKSIFGGTFPTPGFVFDFSGGIVGYRGLDFDYEQYSLNPQGWVKFEKDLITVKKLVEDDKYKTVIIDDLSAMTDLCMERAMQLDPKRTPAGGPLWNVHYQMVKNLMEGRLRQVLNYNCNILFIAHIQVNRDEETGNIINVQPMLTGQLGVRVPGYFDEVYYHSTRKEGSETKWIIQTVPVGWNKARSRLSGRDRLLPDYIENNYSVLMDYLTGKRTKDKVKETKTNGKKD